MAWRRSPTRREGPSSSGSASGHRPRASSPSGLPVSRPAVSQHLKVLKEAGLVVDTAAGTRHIYRLNPDGLAALRAYLEGFWNRALEAFKEAAERPTKEVT